MKLRYRESFGSKAGAAYRLLFVYALSPWMHRYRIRIESDAGFLLESTRRRVSSILGLVPQTIDEETEESECIDDGFNDDSKILRKSMGRMASFEEENQDLRNQVELLLRKQKSLMATIRSLEEASERESGPIEDDNDRPGGETPTASTRNDQESENKESKEQEDSTEISC